MYAQIILAAHTAAEQAQATERLLASKPKPVDPHEVDKILATLPTKAREGRRGNPEATSFLFATWDPFDTPTMRLYLAVRDKLNAMGLRVGERMTPSGELPTPVACGLTVDYASLADASDKISKAKTTWMDNARAMWSSKFGDAGAIQIEGTPYGDVLVFLGPEPSADDLLAWQDPTIPTANRRPIWKSGTDWQDKPVASVVNEAIVTLKIPTWATEKVHEAWAVMTDGVGDIVRSRGLFSTDGVRPVPTLIFRHNESEHTFAVEDVYTLTVDELVERALKEGTWPGLDAMQAKPAQPTAQHQGQANLPHTEQRGGGKRGGR